ncbi:MAG: PilZ domain-containing protein [Desulfobacterales bacterium]|nr:PilZ domain-containing protein [Desulfobacterales bacterium]
MEKREADTPITEKRRHKREKTRVPVEVVTGGRLYKETAKDVSFSGIYIRNTLFHKYEINQQIVLAFESKQGEAHTVEGTIVRKDEFGAGIQFDEQLIPIAFKHAREWQIEKK